MSGEPTEIAPADEAAMLRSYLADRDVPCPGCGYNLRDLPGDRCPECGDELKLRVNLAEPRLAGFIAGLLGLAAGAGFNGLMFLWVLMLSWSQRSRNREMEVAIIDSLVSLLIMGALLALWVRFRRALRGLSKGKFLFLVIGTWVLTMVDLGVFTALVRG